MTQHAQRETLHEAEVRFSQIRHVVYRQVEKDVYDTVQIAIRLTKITDAAATEADGWRYPRDRIPGWSWLKEVRKFQRRPKRVEAAIWLDGQGAILCGLVLGRVSRNRVYASIHYLAANPERDTPLTGRIAQVAIRYLELQAAALGCTTLSIAKPVDGLVDFYGELGFTHKVKKGQKLLRLERQLDHAG
ncbi:hypothetical protein [Vogesella sp. XCS3]|uniref:hypothetical protein n=1 Tax=Vogesella sp. XCS3 TaxID=2877939 RepID=UPI001D0B039D|nr:hypothetical protein [Vogesella sp. XCS3]UDM18934.1 hypothetical protein LCH97_17985 [Vogesella sp. XCS3]